MRRTILAAVAALVFGSFGSLTAAPQPACDEDCVTLAGELATASQDAESLSQRDQDGLEAKALAIGDKLVAGKLDDAFRKLADYTDKLDALALTIGAKKEKVSAEDEATLRDALAALEACMAGAAS